jgi:hypothetical protein
VTGWKAIRESNIGRMDCRDAADHRGRARRVGEVMTKWRKRTAARARTFEEVRAANLADPFHAARIERVWTMGERFEDASAASNDQWAREVSVHPDCEGGSHWFVEWGTATAAATSPCSTGRWPNSGRASISTRSRAAGSRCCERFECGAGREAADRRGGKTMDPGWVQLLIAFVGGSLMTTVITTFVKQCISHPVISVRLHRETGSYGPMTIVEDSTGAWLFDARYFRLQIENTGLSSIKACSAYITSITKVAKGTSTISRQEVVPLTWPNYGRGPRDIPRGAFFHVDVASLYLKPGGSVLHVAYEMPTSLRPLFAGVTMAKYEFEILVAADNARPS